MTETAATKARGRIRTYATIEEGVETTAAWPCQQGREKEEEEEEEEQEVHTQLLPTTEIRARLKCEPISLPN